MADHATRKANKAATGTKKLYKSKRPLYELEADVMKALAHPKRLILLDLLHDGEELNVSQLVELTGISQSNVSQNLAVLRSAGLVTPRRDGHLIYYSVTDPRIQRALATMRAVMDERLNDDAFLAERAAIKRKQAARRASTYAVSAVAGLAALLALGAAAHPLFVGGTMGDVADHVGMMLGADDLESLRTVCFHVLTAPASDASAGDMEQPIGADGQSMTMTPGAVLA